MSEDVFETPASTPNFQTELAEQLAELVPEAVADGKIDVPKLQELLAQDAADTTERFGLFWPGKSRALRIAQMPTTATLRPEPEKSKDWDTTKNVFIEGDNLEVLKILQKHYHGKIKMIYIDPPYNTGKDFVYSDNYKEGLESYLEWTNQVNAEGKKISTNSETEGRYHSNWLSMMYPRLKLARNLLTEDGAIFVSIDDNEVHNLRALMNEIFSEDNFVACITWHKTYSTRNDAQEFSKSHEYLLVYKKKTWNRKLLPRSEKSDSLYKHDDGDGRGRYRTDNLTASRKSGLNPTPLVNPTTGRQYYPPQGASWRHSNEKLKELLDENRIYWGKNGDGAPQLKRYLSEVQDGTIPSTIWHYEDVGHTDSAAKEVKDLIGGGVFDYPKPLGLLKRIIGLGMEAEDIALDFFAGSGTTAQALMEANQSDQGNRRFILVQLPEPTPEVSEARKSGYETIADVSRARVIRASEKLDEIHLMQITLQKLDTGFRTYRLAPSSFAAWPGFESEDVNALEQQLFDLRDSANNAATQEALLTEILIKRGYSLTESIRRVTVGGLVLHSIGEGLVLAYLDKRAKPNLQSLREILAQEPARIIILEDSFQGDDQLKTNLEQLCKVKNIDLWTA